jgi:hypothetical protein
MNRTPRTRPRAKLIRIPEPERRNFLGEAFRIAAGQSPAAPERAHLVAIIAHCRRLVGALMNLPEVK